MNIEADRFSGGDFFQQKLQLTIVEKIAQGGMGEVYEAILKGAHGFEKRVALKVVRGGFIGDGTGGLAELTDTRNQFLFRLVNEAKLVSNLIHTHIVQIYFFGTVDRPGGLPDGYIAMEYVNGVNLRSFIDRHMSEGKSIPAEIAVYIVSRLARALEYAHTRTDESGRSLSIVHRDISPTNVLISAEGVVKLSDFGIAMALMDGMSDAHDYIVGKKRYMAPEQRISGNVDFRADIYSTGIILYELLTADLPLSGEARSGLARKRDDITPEVIAILEKAIARDRDERYASTSEFATDLERAIYERGYGPTFVTLADYLQNLFPSLTREGKAVNYEERTTITRHGRTK